MQLSSINPLIISSSFKELCTTDIFLLASKHQFICSHLLHGFYLVLNQIIASRWTGKHWLADKCSASCLNLDGLWGSWWMIIVFWNFFNYTTPCSTDLETAVTCTCGHFNQVPGSFCSVESTVDTVKEKPNCMIMSYWIWLCNIKLKAEPSHIHCMCILQSMWWNVTSHTSHSYTKKVQK